MAESKGFFRHTAVCLRIASLFNHGLSNSPPDCFHRRSRPSLFESLAVLSTKNKRYSKCYTLYFLAESKGFFGVLPYAFASLRSLTTDFQTVHRTVFIGEADRPCSNPLLSYQQKIKGTANAIPFIFWRRARDSNPRNRFGGLHDFQSCSFDQLGQLSVLPVILYTIV